MRLLTWWIDVYWHPHVHCLLLTIEEQSIRGKSWLQLKDSSVRQHDKSQSTPFPIIITTSYPVPFHFGDSPFQPEEWRQPGAILLNVALVNLVAFSITFWWKIIFQGDVDSSIHIIENWPVTMHKIEENDLWPREIGWKRRNRPGGDGSWAFSDHGRVSSRQSTVLTMLYTLISPGHPFRLCKCWHLWMIDVQYCF